jgi:hypothetical protein
MLQTQQRQEEQTQEEQKAQLQTEQYPLADMSRIKHLHSLVDAEGRTLTAIECGRLIQRRLDSQNGKRKALKDIATELSGHASDSDTGGLVSDYLVLYHVSLRVPSLKEIGWTLARLVRQSCKISYSFKDGCDSLPAKIQDKLNSVLPKLASLEIGSKETRRGLRPDLKMWRKILAEQVMEAPVKARIKSESSESESESETSKPAIETIQHFLASAMKEELAVAFSKCDPTQLLLINDVLSEIFDQMQAESTETKKVA